MRGVVVVVGIRGKLKLQYSLKKYTLRKNHFTNFLPPPLAARLGTAAPRWFPRPGPKCRFRRPSVRSTPPRLLFSVGSPPVCRRRPTPRSFFGGSPPGPVCFRHPTTFPRTARFAETGGQALRWVNGSVSLVWANSVLTDLGNAQGRTFAPARVAFHQLKRPRHHFLCEFARRLHQPESHHDRDQRERERTQVPPGRAEHQNEARVWVVVQKFGNWIHVCIWKRKGSVLSLTVWANSALVMYVVYFPLMTVVKRGLKQCVRIWWETPNTYRARCPPRRGISAARRSPPASRIARRRWFLWW